MRSVCQQLETKYEVPALWTTSASGPGWASSVTDQSAWNNDREEFDELEFDRYTDFHLLTRSLAETTSDTGAISHELRTLIGEFETLLAQQTQLTREAQTRLLQIRMVPFGSIATRLNRVLREVADRQKKSVELIIEGEQTELDKTVLEELVDPLLHLLRNSVDHGVETADVREANGKPATAQVHLSAAHYGTQVVIRIRDDGKGLDPVKIRSGIIQGGFLHEAEVDALSPNELFSYIFLPGFSTASHVTEISGRGVGMDIVRSNIDKLKGSIDVESHAGVGTCFTIRLPTTLVVTRALIALTNNETFAIPTHAVAKIRKVEPAATTQTDGKSMVRVDGTDYELVRFDSHMEFASVNTLSDDTLTVAIVQLGDRFVALLFDTILSTRDIVVKPLGNHLGNVHGLLGATVLGDGSVVPILDPAGLTSCPTLSDSLPQLEVPECELQDVSVMIVDDSVSVRRALTNLIQRADWTPITARDGVDALEKMSELKTPPKVVLLDVEMPRMDGYELLASLRSKPQFEHTPIIMITSRAGEKHRRKAIELGATAYVVKPFQDEPLLHLMQRHIAQSKKLKA
jgi:chemosensory pili system protein ChpA (sensor histidine kinase/response regulator)